MFADRSGFYLLPAVVRTYVPGGQKPVLHAKLTRDHLCTMSGITPEGKLYMSVEESALKGPDVVRFLKHMLWHIPGKVVVWDGAPIHRSQPVKGFVAEHGAERTHLELLPTKHPI